MQKVSLSEFKSWLDGYLDGIENAPDKEQWGVIRGKLNTISEDPLEVIATDHNFDVYPVDPQRPILITRLLVGF